MRLKNKVAIITGSTSGMGKKAAHVFAEEGAKVVVVGRSEDKGDKIAEKIREDGGKAIYVKTDVSKEDDVKKLIKTVVKKWKRIDVLYNNAGIEAEGRVDKTSTEDWEKIMNVNLRGVFLCTKYAIPHMKKGSSIINISSIAGIMGLNGLAAYSASKGGVVALTRQVAADFAGKMIRANCICPGPIKTPMIKRYLEQNPEAEDDMMGMIPANRMGKPEEVVSVALFLASDEASYVTGAVIPVDGGATGVD